MKKTLALRCLAPALLLAGALSAGEPAARAPAKGAAAPAPKDSKPDAALAKRIDALVADLGSELWATREAAQQALVAIGEPAERALSAAAASKDAEVAQRAGEILKAIRGVGFLGIYISDGPEPAEAGEPRGCAVAGRVEGFDANTKELAVGDVILFVDETRIEGVVELQRAVAATKPGKTVKLKVRREGQPKEIAVQIAPWPEDIPKPGTIE